MAMTRIGMIGVALAAGLAVTPSARAVEPEPPAALDTALQDADRLFVANDLAGALAILESACSSSERPECLFSLGAVHHGLGHCSEALNYYRRYREVAPLGERSEEVRLALEEVEGRCGAAAAGAPNPTASRRPTAGAPPPAALPTASVATHAAAAERGASPPSPPALPAGPALTSRLMVGSLVLSGASAVSSVVFGVLAAQRARDCRRARRYDEAFRDECEEDGPRYQGLWQGFAVASASFLGVGMALWWVDSSSTATLGVSRTGMPVLVYGGEF